jgi:hypothetical protein
MEYVVQQIKRMHGVRQVFEAIHYVVREHCLVTDYSQISTEHPHGNVDEQMGELMQDVLQQEMKNHSVVQQRQITHSQQHRLLGRCVIQDLQHQQVLHSQVLEVQHHGHVVHQIDELRKHVLRVDNQTAYVVQQMQKLMHGMRVVMEQIPFVHEVQRREQRLSQQYDEQEHGSVLVLSEVQQLLVVLHVVQNHSVVQRQLDIRKVRVHMHEHSVLQDLQHLQVLHSLLREEQVHGHVQQHEVVQRRHVLQQES